MSRISRCRAMIAIIAIGLVLTGCERENKKSRKSGGRTFVTIGTGGVTGVYFPTGGAISRTINKKSSVYGIKATVESTEGSVYNINAVLNGDLQFGIAQSDRQFQAYTGLAEWKSTGAGKELRSVFSIHQEVVTLIAVADSDIRSVADLKGKRVNLGNAGSGNLQNSRDALAKYGLTEKDVLAEYVKAVETPGLIQDAKLDAFFYTVGHPNGAVKEAASNRIKVRIVPIEGMSEAYPHYLDLVVPIKFYPNVVNTNDVQSFGVQSTLITSTKVGEDVVYAIAKEVFENFKDFKKLHPAYADLTKGKMLQGMSAPLHKGALRYYKESGLIDKVDPKLIQN